MQLTFSFGYTVCIREYRNGATHWREVGAGGPRDTLAAPTHYHAPTTMGGDVSGNGGQNLEGGAAQRTEPQCGGGGKLAPSHTQGRQSPRDVLHAHSMRGPGVSGPSHCPAGLLTLFLKSVRMKRISEKNISFAEDILVAKQDARKLGCKLFTI